jgi:hypothetical protein
VYSRDLPELGEWTLKDLYEFPHAFEQCYAFVYCLDTELEERDREALDYAFWKYPWKGGYSYVNVYGVLLRPIPARDRPVIASLHKASPGWLNLALNMEVAIQVAKLVAILSASAPTAAAAYKRAYTYISQLKVEREKAKLAELKLTTSQIKCSTRSQMISRRVSGLKALRT